jgi:hypothetical protein
MSSTTKTGVKPFVGSFDYETRHQKEQKRANKLIVTTCTRSGFTALIDVKLIAYETLQHLSTK